MVRTFRTHFRKVESRDWYMKNNYDYCPFCNSRYASTNTNMLAHLQNTFVSGFNKIKGGILPKYILIVLDDDLITYLNFESGDGAATLLGSWYEWLMKEFDEVISDWLVKTENKCKKMEMMLYWVAAPTHKYFSKECNNLRAKLNLSLESVIRSGSQNNMCVIKLEEHWNTQDSSLVINDRMTEAGLVAYWRAIDATFHYNEERCEVFQVIRASQSLLNPPLQKAQVQQVSLILCRLSSRRKNMRRVTGTLMKITDSENFMLNVIGTFVKTSISGHRTDFSYRASSIYTKPFSDKCVHLIL